MINDTIQPDILSKTTATRLIDLYHNIERGLEGLETNTNSSLDTQNQRIDEEILNRQKAIEQEQQAREQQINNEANERQQQITTAVSQEAATREQQIGLETSTRNEQVNDLNLRITDTNNVLAGVRAIQLHGVFLTRVIHGFTTVAKSQLVSLGTLNENRSLISDENGTIGAYVGTTDDPAFISVQTLTISPVGTAEPTLLGTVVHNADLPLTVDDAVSRGWNTPRVDDYAIVLNDETQGNQRVKWFISWIDLISLPGLVGNPITWSNPIEMITGDYQQQTASSDAGRVLIGGAVGGTFGQSLGIDGKPTQGSNNLISSGAVATLATALLENIDDLESLIKDGKSGENIFSVVTDHTYAQIMALHGVKVGDYIINRSNATRTIMGQRVPAGGILQIPSTAGEPSWMGLFGLPGDSLRMVREYDRWMDDTLDVFTQHGFIHVRDWDIGPTNRHNQGFVISAPTGTSATLLIFYSHCPSEIWTWQGSLFTGMSPSDFWKDGWRKQSSSLHQHNITLQVANSSYEVTLSMSLLLRRPSAYPATHFGLQDFVIDLWRMFNGFNASIPSNLTIPAVGAHIDFGTLRGVSAMFDRSSNGNISITVEMPMQGDRARFLNIRPTGGNSQLLRLTDHVVAV